jgi:hypothetical protein
VYKITNKQEETRTLSNRNLSTNQTERKVAMYGNQNAGMQWSFFAMLLVVGLALVLGLVISNAELLQPATTQYKIDTMKAEKERAEIARDKEAERQDALTAQAKENAKQTSEKLDNLLQSLFDTLNTSLMIFAVAASIAFAAWSISKSVIAYKMSIIQANIRYQRDIQIANARQLERDARKKELQEKKTKKPTPIETLYTRPFWPDDDKQNHSKRKNYPLAN